MGKQEVTTAEVAAQAKAIDYKRGVHKDRDQILHGEKHRIKRNIHQDASLKRYGLRDTKTSTIVGC
jgi:hypothetical protein